MKMDLKHHTPGLTLFLRRDNEKNTSRRVFHQVDLGLSLVSGVTPHILNTTKQETPDEYSNQVDLRLLVS